MSGHGSMPSQDHLRPWTKNVALEFLNLALREPERPVDRVIDRLQLGDGQLWMEETLARQLSSASSQGCTDLLAGRLTLADIRAQIESAKSAFAESKTSDAEMGSTLRYLLLQAAALRQFRARLTSQDPATLENALSDLACALPTEWSAFVREAAEISATVPVHFESSN